MDVRVVSAGWALRRLSTAFPLRTDRARRVHASVPGPIALDRCVTIVLGLRPGRSRSAGLITRLSAAASRARRGFVYQIVGVRESLGQRE